MTTAQRTVFVRLLLLCVFALSLFRLIEFVLRFDKQTLQMDFSAFYTAGEARNHGLSPYVNNVTAGIWDGVDGLTHSRFLYPPLVAALFQPVAWMPYVIAKLAWMIFSLAALAFALKVSVDTVKLPLRPELVFAIGIVAALFHPVLTLLERGQMDAVTLALVVLAAKWMAPEDRPATAGPVGAAAGRRQIAAGVLLAVAALLKLNIGFVAPFLLLRRKWRPALGFAAGGVLLVLASVGINGPAQFSDYVHHQLPRIERYGEGGPGPVPARLLRPLQVGVRNGFTRKDGRLYHPAYFGFTANATLVRALQYRFHRFSPSGLSLLILAGFAVVMGLLEIILLWRRGGILTSGQEFAYWNMVFLIILLSGPLTWVMNVVWLLPVMAVILWQYANLTNAAQSVALCLCALGLLWAAVPDTAAFPMLVPYGVHWKLVDDLKYVAAECTVFVGLAGLLAAAPAERARKRGAA